MKLLMAFKWHGTLRVCVCVRARACVCVCVYVCLSVCVCVRARTRSGGCFLLSCCRCFERRRGALRSLAALNLSLRTDGIPPNHQLPSLTYGTGERGGGGGGGL